MQLIVVGAADDVISFAGDDSNGLRPCITPVQPTDSKSGTKTASGSIISFLKKPRRTLSITRNVEGLSYYPIKLSILTCHLVDMTKRRKFILKLAKALLSFGAPSHRLESQLRAASDILDAQAGCYSQLASVRKASLMITLAQNSFTFPTSSSFQFEMIRCSQQGPISCAPEDELLLLPFRKSMKYIAKSYTIRLAPRLVQKPFDRFFGRLPYTR